MKRSSLILFIVLASALSAGAQDLITKVTGEEVWAKVIEVSGQTIRYKLWENMNGPTYTMQKSRIYSVVYENGMEEFMRSYPMSEALTAGDVYQGMKFREYKKFYDPRDYVPMYGDRYSPVASGVCSWLVPGMGQMICGEVGRGFAFMGGCAASLYMMMVGLAIMPVDNPGYPNDDFQSEHRGYEAASAVLMMTGMIGYLTSHIWSIVDAPRVAKIKNMYRRDVYDMASVSLRLEPYVATTAGMAPNSGLPLAAGASLKVRF